jgi:anaerobic magnesium-protoporphyrin IX monomethyl ester cyclase
MPLDIVLLTPRRRFIANRFGLGYQMPLGLIFIGGPLIDAGHRVRLIDNDVLGWDDERLAGELLKEPPDCIMLGHTGSTAAHPVAIETARVLKQHLPETTIVYGGVYPSYAAKSVLFDNPAIDIIVQGEGEATAVELADTLARKGPLADVKGITWRDGQRIRANPPRPPIANLDHYRPGWELVDWDSYQIFGLGRAAGMQLSRGCTLTCTYCGQWSFWRRWRHRSPQNFADELEGLVRDHDVRFVWLADENFAADREVARQTLECVIERQLGLSLNLNMTAAGVVRNADILPLFKQAGVDSIIMGVESLDDATVEKVRKNNPFEVSQQAVRLLRQHGIVSFVNIIYGLEDENFSTVSRTFQRLFQLDADIINAVYITPHFWTPAGRNVTPEQIIQPDQRRWTYRNQIINTPHLAPWRLFLGVKLTEALFHLRPKSLWRMLAGPDRRCRHQLRGYMAAGMPVVAAEGVEFLFQTRFVPVGALQQIPGFPLSQLRNQGSRLLQLH